MWLHLEAISLYLKGLDDRADDMKGIFVRVLESRTLIQI